MRQLTLEPSNLESRIIHRVNNNHASVEFTRESGDFGEFGQAAEQTLLVTEQAEYIFRLQPTRLRALPSSRRNDGPGWTVLHAQDV